MVNPVISPFNMLYSTKKTPPSGVLLWKYRQKKAIEIEGVSEAYNSSFFYFVLFVGGRIIRPKIGGLSKISQLFFIFYFFGRKFSAAHARVRAVWFCGHLSLMPQFRGERVGREGVADVFIFVFFFYLFAF